MECAVQVQIVLFSHFVPQSTYRREKRKEIPTMALTINTNISSLIAQRSLNSSTNKLNQALERMTTGYKINSASDDAAGYSIAEQWTTQLSSLDVAANNAAIGSDLLTTAEQSYSLLSDHLQRIRDLTEQAANGTYASASLKAIQAEIYARLDEINRVAANAEFNGIKLMSYVEDGVPAGSGMTANGINLQVGIYSDANSVINLSVDLFKSATISGLFSLASQTTVVNRDGRGDPDPVELTLQDVLDGAGAETINDLNTEDQLRQFAAACSGLYYEGNDAYHMLSDEGLEYGASAMLGFIDNAIDMISDRVTRIGAAQNRIDSAMSALDVQSQNLTSSLSTLKDADVAEESSNYIQSQILQQASATLLATANQSPSLALNLL